ncbi:MAG: hypothetical protein RL660_673 [Bacteroidota bacterium]|jgi:hypothetical protein
MELILKTFKEYFGNKVPIPDKLSKRGIIDHTESGWYIRYVVCEDEQGQKYLDFTAEHRMTNDRHHRITIYGELSYLEMFPVGMTYNPDIPGDYEIQQAKYFEENKRIAQILINKGLMESPGCYPILNFKRNAASFFTSVCQKCTKWR